MGSRDSWLNGFIKPIPFEPARAFWCELVDPLLTQLVAQADNAAVGSRKSWGRRQRQPFWRHLVAKQVLDRAGQS